MLVMSIRSREWAVAAPFDFLGRLHGRDVASLPRWGLLRVGLVSAWPPRGGCAVPWGLDRWGLTEIFISRRRTPLTSMASLFLGTALDVIKVEDEESSGVSGGLVSSEQELMKKFWKDVKRRVELKKRGLLCASGSAQSPPLPHPPVRPPPPPSPPPPAHHPWAKRPATVPPPGFASVRQPPVKQYQRRQPEQRAPAQPQRPAPNAHRTLGPPPVNMQRARHPPQPAPNACRALAPSTPAPVRAMPPPLQRRSAPKPPKHPAAKKKPTVLCAFCGVLCMTAWHLEQHEKGRRHRNKVACLAGEMNVQCQVCKVHLSGALNVAEIFSDHTLGPWWRIGSSTTLSMATQFPRIMPQVIKIEEEGNQDQELMMNRFRNSAPPPPVQLQLPLPPPPPLPPLPLPPPRAKRLPCGLPPGFAGVRQPPHKKPYQRGPAQPQHVPQPASNIHRAPATSLPLPAPASQGAVLVPPATNTVKPPLQRRSAPKPPKHPAARKKPTVPCGLCGVLCMTAWHLKQHEKGRKHRNKAAYLAGEMNVRCPVCNVHLSSVLNVQQHYAGKPHLLRVNRGA
ncbi:hypothetical protein BAE44_0020118 [Dichanthelium oligosanthes]|uniref:C2H2-type domain-containing protein n=1 Tax=Dichanthelium oligosanthes TaxID=888268 RepID=A0A1E5V140_9POAL|nr:hypothetical protein BAE44_0020118 [Dichanthelium oligosanthes]